MASALLKRLRLLTLPQAAALLHVSVRTLHRMIHKQELPAFKVGGQWRLRESQLTEWIERQQFATAPKGERVAWRDQADDAER